MGMRDWIVKGAALPGAVVVVFPVGLDMDVPLMLRFVKKPWLRPTLSSELPNSRPLSKYMPYPARTEVRPSPFGSHAMPSRGAMALLHSLPTLLPNGDFVPGKPLNVGGLAKISPFSGLKFGLQVLEEGTPLTKVTSRLPFEVRHGASAGS